MDKEGQKTKLCHLRDIFRSIREFEISYQEKYGLCLNEGMVLCSLKGNRMSSSDLAEKLGLSASNMSKVIKSVEDKKLVSRILGKEDKRQMYFTLSKKGEAKLEDMKTEDTTIDSLLETIYERENTH